MRRPERVVVTSGTVIVRERRTMRRRSQGWGAALVVSALLWLFVALPIVACALGWVLR